MIKEVEISSCCEIISGSTPSRIVPAYWDGDINWFTPKDLSNLVGKYIDEAPEKITEQGYKSCSTNLLPPFSLMLSSRAPIGHLAINTVPACTNQGFKSLVPKSNIDINYLYYAIKRIVPMLQDLGNGATFKELSKSTLTKVKIPLPPLETQRKIAEILDASDTLRQKTKTLIEKYDQLTQSLFLDMFGNPVSNKLNWDKQSLDEITYKITDGKHGDCSNQDNSGYYFISAKDIVNGYLCYENARQITKNDFEEVDKRTSLEEGDILISNSGTLGKVAIANDPVKTRKTTFQKSVAILKINPKYLIPIYTKYLLTHDKNSLIKNSTGSSQKNLLISQIKGYQIITPPLPLQTQFAEKVQAIEVQKAKAQASLEKSEELFQSLLQRAFNGKLV